jgi:uncharacterized repeat protein (TIGR02543 family)
MKKSTKLKMGIAVLMAVIGLLFTGCPTGGGGGGDGDTYYTVTFDANGGVLADPSDVSVSVKEGESLGASFPGDPTITGSDVFQGWFTNTSYTQDFTATTHVTADITVIAGWGANVLPKYTVSFNTNGGETIDSIPNVLENTVLGARMPANPTRDGHYFYGWYIDNAIWNQLFTASTLITANTQVYARWETSPPQYFTITLDPDGGTGTPASVQVLQGEAGGDLPIPTKPGHDFDGWYTAAVGGTPYNSTDTVTEATTLYAKWTKIKYTVTFDAGLGTLVGPSSVEREYDEALGEVDDPTRPGIDFEGWYTQPGGAGTRYTAATTITMNITLYANWVVDHSLDGEWVHVLDLEDSYVITINGDTWSQEQRETTTGVKNKDFSKGTLSKSGNTINLEQTHQYISNSWQENTSSFTADLSGDSFDTYVVAEASEMWTYYKKTGNSKTVTVTNIENGNGITSSTVLILGLFQTNTAVGMSDAIAVAASLTRSGGSTGPVLLYTLRSDYSPEKLWTGSDSYYVGVARLVGTTYYPIALSKNKISFSGSTTLDASKTNDWNY